MAGRITQALQALARNSCTGHCDQGRRCNCGNRQPWTTTSDPMAWVQINDGTTPVTPMQMQQHPQQQPIAPQNARRIPRARLPLRLRDWVAAAVFVAAVLAAQAVADMPTDQLLKGVL